MNANEPAFPSIDVDYQQGLPTTVYHHGLTKRELFAAMAMQGLMRHPDSVGEPEDVVAVWAVKAADALIAALSEEKK